MSEHVRDDGQPHALVVGGSGMLRGASLHLAEQGYVVSVVGRRAERLEALAGDATGLAGRIVPLSVDYRETDRFRESLLGAVRANGPISLAVCWIHSTAPEAPDVVAQVVAPDSGDRECRYFQVRGSAGSDPSSTAQQAEDRFAQYPGLAYRQVILGFVVDGGASRWLTNEEISDGVIAAIDQDADYTIVGTVEPWSMRP